MDCKTWRELASDYMDGALDTPMAEAMARHAVACASCRSDEEALRNVCRELNVLPTVDPPLFFRENLISAIERGELGAKRPVAGSFWQILFPRLGRVAVGTFLAGGVCDLRKPCSHRSPVPGVQKTLCAADRGLDAGFVGHGGWLYHALHPGPSIRRMAAIT